MRMLKFGAVDFDTSMRISEERLRDGLDHARLAGAGRPQKQKIADGPTRRIQTGEKHLIDLGDLLHGWVLADDLAPQSGFKIQRLATAPRRIQGSVQSCFHNKGQLTGLRTHLSSQPCE